MKYFVETYGCTMNFGEGRSLSEDMASLGYEPADNADDADIVVLNTCTVVETTEKRMLSRISELKRQGKRIVVTGCMAKVQPKRITIRLPDSPVVPFEDYGRFRDIVRERYGCIGAPVVLPTGPDAILPIAQGCLGHCSYCITKFARGDLVSYPAGGLLERFDMFLGSGAKEVLITAQDTSSYGRDIGTDLPALLRSMLQRDGDFRIRLGMTNPDSLARVSEGVIEAMDDDRMYRFVHIPVQSGSDEVLRRMRRKYTVEDFMDLVSDLRAGCEDISIATDLICGFPGETEEDHQKSVDLIRELRADTVNITRFSSRPGTDAASMEQVHGRISAERSAELTNVKNATELDVNSAMVGRRYRSLATERGKEGTIVRTGNYRPVVIRNDIPLGTFVDVEVTENRPTYLLGRLVRPLSEYRLDERPGQAHPGPFDRTDRLPALDLDDSLQHVLLVVPLVVDVKIHTATGEQEHYQREQTKCYDEQNYADHPVRLSHDWLHYGHVNPHVTHPGGELLCEPYLALLVPPWKPVGQTCGQEELQNQEAVRGRAQNKHPVVQWLRQQPQVYPEG